MDIKLIKEIRTQTGASFGDCKKALEQVNGDLNKAIEIASNMFKAQQDKENEDANTQTQEGAINLLKSEFDKLTEIISDKDDLNSLRKAANHISKKYDLGLTEEQKKKYLPRFITGELITAIAMTEPGAGSDLQGTKTTAVLDGDHYILNGSKTFITNGQKAGLVIVVAKTDSSAGSKGISLFLVEADLPGFSKGKNLNKLGLKAQDTSELFFQDVRVPKENLLGEEGRGFIYLMQDLPQERLSIAVGAVANAKAILEATIDYTKERKAFGTTVASFQNTQFKLAELSAEIDCAEVYTDRCTELLLDDKLDTVTASKAKLLTTDLQCKVADECLQLFGGWGYMWEYPVCRAFADSRIQRIYGGTNEIMKLIISRELMK